MEDVVQRSREPAIDVFFDPQHRAGLPIEVLKRQEMMRRMPARHMRNLQRARFHQLVLCSAGTGIHHVDFTPHELSAGTVLHIRPGQVQEFEVTPELVADMVLWPVEYDPKRRHSPVWYPGSGVPTAIQLEDEQLTRLQGWIGEMRIEQARFGESERSGELLETMLKLILIMLDDLCGTTEDVASTPQAYLDLRKVLEQRLFSRPTVGELGAAIGYSTRTLDRACEAVTGQTAKQVVDERIGLELRRLLADPSRPIADVRDAFDLGDPSNFTKFVRRHLGQAPGEFRHAYES